MNMYRLTIHGNRGGAESYTFTPFTNLRDALMEIARINDQRRWSGLDNAVFSLVRSQARFREGVRRG